MYWDSLLVFSLAGRFFVITSFTRENALGSNYMSLSHSLAPARWYGEVADYRAILVREFVSTYGCGVRLSTNISRAAHTGEYREVQQ